MRWINRAIALAAVLSLSAVSAWAQAKECDDEFKTATYSKWYDNRKDHQAVAYEAAKEYLAVCTVEDQYTAVLKKFVADYDKIHSNQKLATDFEAAVKANRYADQVRIGKQFIAMHPEETNVYLYMANAGLNDATLLTDSAEAAKKAIELITAGKTFTVYNSSRDQALAAMNYVLAKATMRTSPTDAIPFFVKALRFESGLKKDPRAYNELATAYGEGPLDKLAKEYKTLADAGKSVESPEIKLVVANLNQVLDRQIDAFARAAAVTTSDADKKEIMNVLTAVYKDRHKKDPAVGEMDTLVASALSRPVPDAPTPITTLPASSTGSTPTGTTGAPASNTTGGSMPGNGGSGSPATSTSAATKPATGTGTTSAPAKPAASPKPKPRRNHARR